MPCSKTKKLAAKKTPSKTEMVYFNCLVSMRNSQEIKGIEF